jgi:hypothetical protein
VTPDSQLVDILKMFQVIIICLLGMVPGVKSRGDFSDINMAFRHNSIAAHLDLQDNEQSSDRELHLLCSSYKSGEKMKTAFQSNKLSAHPVYLSKTQDSICHIALSTSYEITQLTRQHKFIRVSKISRALKVDDTVYSIYDDILMSEEPMAVDLDISLGLGVNGKGLRLGQHTHQSVLHDVMASSASLSSPATRNDYSQKLAHNMIKKETHTSLRTSTSVSKLFSKYNDRTTRALQQICDFSTLKAEHLQSHISLRFLSTDYLSSQVYADCVFQFVSLASLHIDVTHIAAHFAPVLLLPATPDISMHSLDSLHSFSSSYLTGKSPTDQNAYVQTGTSAETPYSDMGLSGQGYVLGMIDSGIDDLSCFLVNYDGTETTRTAKMNYGSPTTEVSRRK